MERKLLWVISSIVILILWLKIEPQGTQQTGSKTVTTEQPAPKSVPEQPKRENSREASVTEEEQEYFKSHPIEDNKPNFAGILRLFNAIRTRKKCFIARR